MAWDREKEKKAGKAMTMASSVYGLVFSIVWCIFAASMRVWLFVILGLFIVGMSAYRLYVCIQLSKEEKKKELPPEVDPWDRPSIPQPSRQETAASGKFCPYCGFELQEGFEFCPKCGRRQP